MNLKEKYDLDEGERFVGIGIGIFEILWWIPFVLISVVLSMVF